MERKYLDQWDLAGIDAQAEAQKLTMYLSPFKSLLKTVALTTDSDTNRSFVQKQVDITNQKLEVEIKPNGGFVVVLYLD